MRRDVLCLIIQLLWHVILREFNWNNELNFIFIEQDSSDSLFMNSKEYPFVSKLKFTPLFSPKTENLPGMK